MRTLQVRVVALGATVALLLTTSTVVAARELTQRNELSPREQIAAQHKSRAKPNASHKTVRLATGAFDPRAKVPEVPANLTSVDPRYWLVQVEYPATKPTRLAIEAAGAKILTSMPDVTYVVRADAETADAVRTIERVRWVGAYEPAYKIAPALEDLEGSATVRVWTHEGVDARTLAPAIAAAAAAKPSDVTDHVVVVNASKANLAALARIEDVAWIDQMPTYESHNANALWVTDTGERDILGAAAPGRLDGKGQTAAVADTGINYIPDDNGNAQSAFSDCTGTTCKLADYVSEVPGNSVASLEAKKDTGEDHRKMAAYFNLDADDPNARSLEGSWHGTHVAGSVAGDYPDASGDYGTRSREADGIAVAARLAFQDIEAEGGLGGLPSSPFNLFNQVYDLNDNGEYDPLEDSRTHNNSYGAIYPEVDAGGGHAADNFIYTHPDMTVVFSAANSGPDAGSLAGGPQVSKNVITSCASANGRQPLVAPDAAAIFSSHGPTLDGRIKPDVCTPGQINVSPKGGTVDDDQYLQGTSMSGPLLVGLVTLVRQYFWDGFGPVGNQGYARGTRDFGNRYNPSAALVKAVTINSAQRMRGYYTGDDGGQRALDGQWPSSGQGFGKVELDKALYFPGDDRALFTVDRPNDADNGLETGNDNSEFIDVAPGQPLDITLTWTDPPSAQGVGTPTLVNDLDLVVTAPDGTEYLGNEFTTQSPSLGVPGDPSADVGESVPNATLPDEINNVEGVRLQEPQAGRWTVTVKGTDVVEGPQGYSLAVSGRIATDQARIVFDAAKYKPGATATAYLLGTGLSGDTINGFTKVGPSIYSQEIVASGSQISVSGGGATGTAPVDSEAPAVSNVVADPSASDLAKITWTTDEPSTGEVVITGPDGEATFPDVYVVEGFPGLTTPQAETAGTYLNKPVKGTKHEVHVSGLKPGEQYSYVINATDEAGNTGGTAPIDYTSTAAIFSPNAPDIAMLLSGDITTGIPETPDANLACGVAPITTCQSWGTSTQLYAGAFVSTGDLISTEAMPAFMFRMPESVDPSTITGAAVQLFSGHDIVDPLNDHTVYSLSLVDSGAEDSFGPGGRYIDIKSAEADVQLAADPTLRRGANKPYTWHVPCNQLEAFKTNLAEDTGEERRAGFRLEVTTELPESLFSFETGYGRRSRGPTLRPKLILFQEGVDPMPCNATAAPEISHVLVDHVEETSAVVAWRTDVSSDSTVFFRKAGETEWTPVSAPVRTTQHFVRIEGLEANGPYEFVVQSATCNGLVSTDDNGGKSYALFDEAFHPAAVGGIYARPSPTENTTQLVGWGSDQQTTSVVRYGTSPDALTEEVSSDEFTDTHQLEIPGLSPCTRYYFQVSGENQGGAVSSGPVLAFDRPPTDFTEVVTFDFEADIQGWANVPPGGTGTTNLAETSHPTTFERRPEPSMGSQALRTTIAATDTPGYTANMDQRVVSPPIAVPAGSSVLEFREWFTFEGVQGVEAYEEPMVEVSLDNGGSWIRLREGIASQNADFPEPSTVQLPLPAGAAGKNILVSFRLRTDPLNETPGGGWAIDDVTILNGQCGSIPIVDPSIPVAGDDGGQGVSSQAIREVPGPTPPSDGSGDPIGVLPALVAPPSQASLDAGTCRCTDITYLGQVTGGGGGGGGGGAGGGGGGAPHPATGGGVDGGVLAALLAVALAGLAFTRRTRLGPVGRWN